jgi:hypothetical protein
MQKFKISFSYVIKYSYNNMAYEAKINISMKLKLEDMCNGK